MEQFLKATAAVLITVVLLLILDRQDKPISALLVMAVCSMITVITIEFLHPVISFLQQLQRIAKVDQEHLLILMKSLGIGILCEITGLICSDSGHAALGKSLQLLAVAAILLLSVPLYASLLAIITEILGGL